MHRSVYVTVPALFDYLFPPKVHSFSVKTLATLNLVGYASTAQLVRFQYIPPDCAEYEQVNMWLIQNLGSRTGFLLQKMMKQVVGRSRCCMQCFPGKLTKEPQK